MVLNYRHAEDREVIIMNCELLIVNYSGRTLLTHIAADDGID